MFRFTPAGALPASPTDLENAASSALRSVPDGASFVVVRDGDGLRHLLVTDGGSTQEGVAFAAARAMAARSTEVTGEGVPDLRRPGVARLVALRDVQPAQDPQAGADFTQVSKIIGGLLMPGEWVGVSVRKPWPRLESRPYKVWLGFAGMRTHQSLNTSAVVASFWAGAGTRRRAVEVVERAVSAVPGFGIPSVGRPVTAGGVAAGWLLAGVVGAGLAVLHGWVAAGAAGAGGFRQAAGLLDGMLPGSGWWGWVAAALGLVLCVLTVRGVAPSPRWRAARAMRGGLVPAAPHRVKPPRPPRSERTARGDDGRTVTTEAFTGDYPLHKAAFMEGAHIPLALVAPHAGGQSGAMSTADRPAPGVLAGDVGPTVGVSGGVRVHLPAGDLWSGVALVGNPGSGKTALAGHLWGRACRDRMAGVPGRHVLVGLDTKPGGEAAVQYRAWSETAGDRVVVVDVFDPSTPGVDLFPTAGVDAAVWGRQVAAALRYVWGEQSVGAESFATLSHILCASRFVTGPVVAGMRQPVAAGMSPFFYANVLVGNRGDEQATDLAAGLADAAAVPGADRGLVEAVAGLRHMFGTGVSRAQRAGLMKAPRNKLDALQAAEQFWSRPRRVTWGQVLDAGLAVVVCTGGAPDGKLRDDLAGLVLYTLVEQVKRTCAGWQGAGMAVSVFADEVKAVASGSPEQVRWMREDGRSFGVRPVMATQTADTLDPQVWRTLLGFGTLVAFAQNERRTAEDLAGNLSLGGEVWEPQDLVNLPRFSAVVRTSLDGERLPPFVAAVPDFAAEREAGTWVG